VVTDGHFCAVVWCGGAGLFEPLPVRRAEFKRSITKQSAKLVRVLQGYALISVGVRITCTNFKGPKAARYATCHTRHALVIPARSDVACWVWTLIG
jgi:hypothetical protein